MVCLESFEGMPASKDEISEALEENIKIKNGYGPKEIIKDEDGNVKEIIFKKCLRTIDPQTGKFDPLYEEDDTMIIKADTIIFAIGQKVIWNDLLKDTQVKFHHGSYPIADPLTYQTDEEDIFVGGDVYTGPKFVIDAIAAGHKASDSLHRYVHKGASLTIGKDTREFISLDKTIVKYPEYKRLPRQEASYDEDIDRKTSFRDASGVLSEEQVKKEVSRCLGCGLSIVDPNKCIGCGICTTRCQFDAIHLFRDHGEQTHMVRTEDKFKYILPYQLKRALKIMVSYKSKEEKKYEKSYQEFRQKLSALKEENK
jgi:ferredoxin